MGCWIRLYHLYALLYNKKRMKSSPVNKAYRKENVLICSQVYHSFCREEIFKLILETNSVEYVWYVWKDTLTIFHILYCSIWFFNTFLLILCNLNWSTFTYLKRKRDHGVGRFKTTNSSYESNIKKKQIQENSKFYGKSSCKFFYCCISHCMKFTFIVLTYHN